MSLSVRYWVKGKKSLYTEFENEAFYWFMYPHFEKLRNTHGIYIDLYGDAKFSKVNINLLDKIISETLEEIAPKPRSWEVHTGTQTHPVVKEIYSNVNKDKFTEFLNKLGQMIELVKTESGTITFIGD